MNCIRYYLNRNLAFIQCMGMLWVLASMCKFPCCILIVYIMVYYSNLIIEYYRYITDVIVMM